MRLTRKVLLALIASVVLILGLAAWVQVQREVDLFDRDTARDHEVLGRILAVAVARTWQIDGEAAARALLDEESRRSGRMRFRWLAAAPSAVPAPRGEMRTTLVPVDVGARRVAIEVVETRAEERAYIDTSVQRAVMSSLLLVLMCSGAAAVVGVVFVGRPTRQLVEKARRIGTGDLSGPLELRQRDELGELATEINNMCTRLAEAGEQLRHADRLKTVGMLAAGIAHELGTPLNVVAGRAEMIASGETEGPGVAGAARIIGAQAERMTRIIRQLLDFARSDGGERAARPLAAIAAQTVGLLKTMATKRGVSLRTGESDEGATARVDAEQISQALTNLVVNAIHATTEGGEVVVSVRRVTARPPADRGGPEGPHVRVEVRDTGAGMHETTVAHIFEPFFTTKQVGEGTGLGLAVAYGIVRDHRGWIDVASRLGAGTTMAILLPSEEVRA